MDARAHWRRVYREKAPDEVSWYEEHPSVSVDLIRATGLGRGARVLDVGGGASRLVDCLLEGGFGHVGVLDIAGPALEASRERLGAVVGSAADAIEWIEADVRTFRAATPWDLWHDRAVFHFLRDPDDRAAYRATLVRTVSEGGHVVVAAFGPGGPRRCSGLDVCRYSAQSLAEELGPVVRLVESRTESHRTPSGSAQEFVYGRFVRTAGP